MLTNFLVDLLSEESSEGEVQQFFSDVLVNEGGIFGFCNTFSEVRVFIAPPNVRLRPTWYARLRPLILRVFHQFLETGPLNLQVIEDFSGEFDKDQVHYTILSGIYYVQHLADRVGALLEAPAPVKSQR